MSESTTSLVPWPPATTWHRDGWTPDGRFVLFLNMDDWGTWVVAADGGQIAKLANAGSVAVSPDGTHIAYMGQRGATHDGAITIRPVTETPAGLVPTGTPTVLAVTGGGLVWSPDGHRLLYTTTAGPDQGLGIVNADGSNATDLLAGSGVRVLGIDRPGFSADGSTVSFVGTDSVVYYVGADGRRLRPAIHDAIPGIDPHSVCTAWSSDHQHLAALADGANTIIVIDTTGHLIATVHLPVHGDPIGVSFDGSGQVLYYMGMGPEPNSWPPNLYSIALDGSGSRPLTTDSSVFVPPTVLP